MISERYDGIIDMTDSLRTVQVIAFHGSRCNTSAAVVFILRLIDIEIRSHSDRKDHNGRSPYIWADDRIFFTRTVYFRPKAVYFSPVIFFAVNDAR